MAEHNPNLTADKARRAIAMLLCAVWIGVLTGCGSWVTEFRRSGFEQIQMSFDAIPATPDLYEVVEINRVRVHIVGDRRYFAAPSASAFGSPIVGYATRSNDIWVFGKVVDGRIVVNQAVLGHELNHLISFKNSEIADPDKLDRLGL